MTFQLSDMDLAASDEDSDEEMCCNGITALSLLHPAQVKGYTSENCICFRHCWTGHLGFV